MRYVTRAGVKVPEALADSDGLGRKEREAALLFYMQQLTNVSARAKKKSSFTFAAYKDASVKQALEDLFFHKCAYCESEYAGNSPVDVEHWRPKAEVFVDTQGKNKSHGYYWLAADWENLLPSCIDCNRVRKHKDFVTGEKVPLGKGNWFPVLDESKRWKDPNTQSAEEPLLLNPCFEDPAQYLEFDGHGVVRIRNSRDETKRLKAEASIRFYALNRNGLVKIRQRSVKAIQKTMTTLQMLIRQRDDLRRNRQPTKLIETILFNEFSYLNGLQKPDRPFSVMSGQMIKEFLKELSLM